MGRVAAAGATLPQFDATLERWRRRPLTVVSAGAVRIAIAKRRDSDPGAHAWGSHLCFALAPEARPGLVSKLDELGAGYEDVRGRIYARDPDGFTLEFLFGGDGLR